MHQDTAKLNSKGRDNLWTKRRLKATARDCGRMTVNDSGFTKYESNYKNSSSAHMKWTRALLVTPGSAPVVHVRPMALFIANNVISYLTVYLKPLTPDAMGR